MFLIIGKDAEEVKRSLERIVGKEGEWSSVFYPENFTQEALFQEIETPPFLSNKKNIIIHQLQQLSEKDLELVLKFLEKPSPWISLYLTASELPPQHKCVKIVEKKGKVIRLKEEKAWEREERLKEWVLQEAVKEHIEISGEVALEFVQRVDAQTLVLEWEKLVCFAKKKGVITRGEVYILSTAQPHETVWNLSDAIFARETTRAFSLSRSLLQEGINLFQLLAGIRTQFINGIEILNAAEKGTLTQQFSYLKGKLLQKKLVQLKIFGKMGLKKGAIHIFETEVRAKNSTIEPSLLLELLISQLVSIR